MSREPATLIILAGGESKRMGFPKHQLVVDGRRVLDTLHERLGSLLAETLVVGRSIADLPRGARLVEDLYDIRAALVGIHAGLSASTTDLCFVVACDMPTVEPALVDYLLSLARGYDVVVPVVRGYYEPLVSAYRTSCLPAIEEMTRQGSMKVSRLFERVHHRAVEERDLRRIDVKLRSFLNLNTAERTMCARRSD